MSLELIVTLPSGDLPERTLWQAEIDKLALDVQLDPDLDLSMDEGYSPTSIAGRSSGFEIAVLDQESLAEDYPELLSHVTDVSKAVCFTWGGDLLECACVMGAAAGLVAGSRGTAYYPDDDLFYTGIQLTDEYRTCLAET